MQEAGHAPSEVALRAVAVVVTFGLPRRATGKETGDSMYIPKDGGLYGNIPAVNSGLRIFCCDDG